MTSLVKYDKSVVVVFAFIVFNLPYPRIDGGEGRLSFGGLEVKLAMSHRVTGLLLSLVILSTGIASAQDGVRAPASFAPWSPSDLRIGQSLLITDALVDGVGKPVRPEWGFGYLMRQMAGARPPAEFTRRWVITFTEPQDINGLKTLDKPGARNEIISVWKARLGDASMTDEEWVSHKDFFDEAPFRLVGIVNRIDLVKLAQRHGAFTDEFISPGEGRLVFQLTNTAGEAREGFTVIFEYGIPVANQEELGAWAQDWLDLATPGLTEDQRLDALVQITKRFTDRDPFLARPNNSPLHQLRTNEIHLGNPWELREFRIAADGWLSPSTVNLNPDFAYSGLLPGGQADPSLEPVRDMLVAYIQSCVRGEVRADVPGDVVGNVFSIPHAMRVSEEDGIPGITAERPFLGASAPTPFRPFIEPDLSQDVFETRPTWLAGLFPAAAAPGPTPAICSGADLTLANSWEANRRWFAFNTCSGCHGAEAGAEFTHIDVTRTDADEHVLSSFLRLEDLPARGAALELFAALFGSGTSPAPSEASPSAAPPSLAGFLNGADARVPLSSGNDVESRQLDLRAFLLQMQTRTH